MSVAVKMKKIRLLLYTISQLISTVMIVIIVILLFNASQTTTAQ